MLTLEAHRQRMRLTIRELAQRARVSTETLSRINRGGRVHFGTQQKIAEALGVEPDDIAEFAGEGIPVQRRSATDTDILALVKLAPPTPEELAEADRRIERGYREGFYAADPETGEPTDERVSIEESVTRPT